MTDPWRHLAACREHNSEYWFPDKTGDIRHNPAAQKAIRICGTCPVQAQCLEWSITKPEHHGIWGGLTAEERRGLRLAPHRRIRHGTKAGYDQHFRWGQQACPDCKRAHADYSAARRRIADRTKTRHQITDEDTA